ncbi:hypothetical protein [Desulfurobacterium sp.]|uniref:hypothetical protein n=1 Tax=Desulfurobacterium sp. TaxID=2004706 RepID=UPI0026122385|nr:hypothetical protein [Desulfurobacterium sp.]
MDRETVKNIAEVTGLTQETVRAVLNFYWREVLQSLIQGKKVKTPLGQFRVGIIRRQGKVYKTIRFKKKRTLKI